MPATRGPPADRSALKPTAGAHESLRRLLAQRGSRSACQLEAGSGQAQMRDALLRRSVYDGEQRRIGEQLGKRVPESLEVGAVLRRDIQAGGERGVAAIWMSSSHGAWRMVFER